jgi:hypothetical protein
MTAGVQLKKITGRESQGACLQDELIGGKPPVSLTVKVVSAEATGFCISIGISELLLAAVYKIPGHAWNADITELLSHI